MREWVDAAVLVKTRNLGGRFVVRGTAGLPFLLEEGVEVAFVPPVEDMPRSAAVAWTGPVDGGAAEVEFSGVEDGSTAKALVGSHCLVRRTPAVQEAIDAEPASWEGWQVVDADLGPLGTVAGLEELPGQVLLRVAREGGKEALIPVVDEFVLHVDAAGRCIEVAIPAGLLDL